MIHFELVFLKGVGSLSKLIFLYMDVSVTVPFVEKSILSPFNCLCSFIKHQLTVFGPISGLRVLLH